MTVTQVSSMETESQESKSISATETSTTSQQLKPVPRPFSIEALISGSHERRSPPRQRTPPPLLFSPQQLYPWLGVPPPIYVHPPTFVPLRQDSEEEGSDSSMSPKDLTKNNGKCAKFKKVNN